MEQLAIIELDIKKLMRDNLVWTIVLVFLFVPLNLILQSHSWDWSIFFVIKQISLFCIYYVLLIVLHEAFHLIGFILFGKVPLKSLSYGIKFDQGLAYATTTELLTNRAMKASLLLPFWVTGVLPTVVGFYVNSNMLILVGAFLMAGAVGDFMMYKELRKYPNHYFIKDDPQQPKLYVYKR